jgi:acetyl-CoA decarbonylase/synthase complex subunit gamma
MHYTVAPGLYAVGSPTPESPVLVSANYKLSFDHLRRSLDGVDAWVLVLDTLGINVWCAAGKGTFGTKELVSRVALTKLGQVVTHRRLIVPQLGAPGIAAHEVKAACGFVVAYGPVYARDIPAYLAAGCNASPAMRRTRFAFVDRFVLTPMELIPAVKLYPWFALAVLCILGLYPTGILFTPALQQGWPFLALGLVAIVTGTVLTPLLLPWIPFRSFALKGWVAGLAGVGAFQVVAGHTTLDGQLITTSAYAFFPAVSSYLALNFTGCTTFTNKSGVKRELKVALWLYLAAAALSVIAIAMYKLRTMGLL